MSQNKGKKGWPQVGSIRVGKNKETNENYTYMKLADNVEILVDGEKITLNKFRTLRFERPTDKVNQLRDKGIIDEKTAEQRLEKLAEMPWLKYDVVAAPPKDNE